MDAASRNFKEKTIFERNSISSSKPNVPSTAIDWTKLDFFILYLRSFYESIETRTFFFYSFYGELYHEMRSMFYQYNCHMPFFGLFLLVLLHTYLLCIHTIRICVLQQNINKIIIEHSTTLHLFISRSQSISNGIQKFEIQFDPNTHECGTE